MKHLGPQALTWLAQNYTKIRILRIRSWLNMMSRKNLLTQACWCKLPQQWLLHTHQQNIHAHIWFRSYHTACGQSARHNMRIITGTICSTPLPCLHVLSSIAKPHIWFSASTQRMLQKVEEFPHLPIQDILNLTSAQLQSDALSVGTPHQLTSPPNQPGNMRWASKDVPNKHWDSDLTIEVPSNDLPRRQWSTLNRTSFRSRCSLFFANLSQMGQQP